MLLDSSLKFEISFLLDDMFFSPQSHYTIDFIQQYFNRSMPTKIKLIKILSSLYYICPCQPVRVHNAFLKKEIKKKSVFILGISELVKINRAIKLLMSNRIKPLKSMLLYK